MMTPHDANPVALVLVAALVAGIFLFCMWTGPAIWLLYVNAWHAFVGLWRGVT